MDYFPHDTDAASDEKVESLRILYGNDGYAFYFILLERIYRTADFELDVSDAETRQILARKVEVTPQKFEDMLATAIRRGCFDAKAYNERGVLTSAGVKKRAENVVGKRQKMAAAYSNRVSAAETGEETLPETPQSKVKEIKGKEIKGKEIKETSSFQSDDAATAAAPAPEKKIDLLSATPIAGPENPQPQASHTGGPANVPTLKAVRFVAPDYEMLLAHMVAQRPHNPLADVERVAAKCFGYYAANGWKVGRNPMKDWRAACQTFLADVPKLTAGVVLAPTLAYRPAYGGPPVSQVDTRLAAIAGAHAMFDRLDAGLDPFNRF